VSQAYIIKCDELGPGEQIWFSSRFEAEQTILPVEDGGCCELVPVGPDYDGPRWVPEDEESQ